MARGCTARGGWQGAPVHSQVMAWGRSSPQIHVTVSPSRMIALAPPYEMPRNQGIFAPPKLSAQHSAFPHSTVHYGVRHCTPDAAATMVAFLQRQCLAQCRDTTASHRREAECAEQCGTYATSGVPPNQTQPRHALGHTNGAPAVLRAAAVHQG